MSVLVRITNGKFPFFASPLSIEVLSNQRWAVVGPQKHAMLDVLAGKHVPEPPNSLSYPAFSQQKLWPSQAIAYLRFDQVGQRASHLSARYESFRDEFDSSLVEVLNQSGQPRSVVNEVVEKLHLKGLENRWYVALSNGQTRRAELARLLLKKPKMLIVDEPFLGLDQENGQLMDQVLSQLSVPVVCGLHIFEDRALPPWITHVFVATADGVTAYKREECPYRDVALCTKPRRRVLGKPVIELRGVSVKYSTVEVLKNIWLNAHEGERLHIKGSNGSGKSTIFAMVTGDHPQSWQDSIVLFGEPREVGKHYYQGINADIGLSSPEVHSIFPRHYTLERTVASGLQKPDPQRVQHLLDRLDLPADVAFSDATYGQQKLALFARALAKNPRILLLDEAFSTLSSRELYLAFKLLDEHECTVLLIGHVADELPPVDTVYDLDAAKIKAST